MVCPGIWIRIPQWVLARLYLQRSFLFPAKNKITAKWNNSNLARWQYFLSFFIFCMCVYLSHLPLQFPLFWILTYLPISKPRFDSRSWWYCNAGSTYGNDEACHFYIAKCKKKIRLILPKPSMSGLIRYIRY